MADPKSQAEIVKEQFKAFSAKSGFAPTPPVDTHVPDSHSSSMANGPTRDEIDAKLAAAEARTETRIAHLEGTVNARFVELDANINRMVDSNITLAATVTKEIGRVHEELVEVKEDNKFTRWTIGVTVIASALAGLGALWLTQANLLAAFQTVLALAKH